MIDLRDAKRLFVPQNAFPANVYAFGLVRSPDRTKITTVIRARGVAAACGDGPFQIDSAQDFTTRFGAFEDRSGWRLSCRQPVTSRVIDLIDAA